MTETIPIERKVQEAYKVLTDALKTAPSDWGKRIAVHLRLTTGTALLHIFNQSDRKPEEKLEVYVTCIKALLNKDASGLKVAPPEPAPVEVPAAQRIDPVNVAVIHESPPCQVVAKPPVVDVEEVKHNERQLPVPQNISAVRQNVSNASVLEQLAQALSPHINPPKVGVDEAEVNRILDNTLENRVKALLGNGAFPADRVKSIVDEAMKNVGVRRIDFTVGEGQVRSIEGLMHPQVTQVARWIQADVPVWVWSAAGSGKTHMGRQIAAIEGVECYVISVDPTLTVAKILGYRNVANGDFVPGLAYPAYKNGGLLVLDEIDTGDAGVIASINAMLSNGHYLFPNGETVKRHEKFRVLACANTKGTGAVAGYTARNKLDAATLDRFAIIEFKYDEGLELAIATGEGEPGKPWRHNAGYSLERIQAYAKWVIKVRNYVGNSVLVSPRATINGCKALSLGIPMNEVIDALVFKLASEDTITRIKHACPLPV